jgi:signal peptidase I
MFRRLLFLLALSIGGALILRAYVVEAIVIPTGSMEPTIFTGAHGFVNKLAYRKKGPARGDIVCFDSPVDPTKGLVKRAIAVGGDEVRIQEKKVILNGQELAEPYVKHIRPGVRFADDNMDIGRVPEGHVFVMGDNRDASEDSRNWKNPDGTPIYFIPVKKLTGKVVGVR